MIWSPIQKTLFTVAVIVGILTASGIAHATPLEVTTLVSPTGGGLFHYLFTIGNSGPDDVAIVSVVAPLGDPFIDPTLTFPAGFLASYDSGLGFVDFLEDTDLFAAGMIVSGFAFDSASGPMDGFFETFEALTVNGDSITGTATVTAVPEPASIMLLASGMCTLFLREMKRKHKP